MNDHYFGSSLLDRTWRVTSQETRLLESRFEKGHSFVREREGRLHIDASTHLEDLSLPADISIRGELRDFADLHGRSTDGLPFLPSFEKFDFLHGFALSVRLVEESRLVASSDADSSSSSMLYVFTARRHDLQFSLVMNHDSFGTQLALVEEQLRLPLVSSADAHATPLIWKNGTGAVLLHEAIGHASLSGAANLIWPASLNVVDDPAAENCFGTMLLDDCGLPAEPRNLTSGQCPASWRRESFRHAPLQRMSNLIVSGGHVSSLPDIRIEISLVTGGTYDPLSELVTLTVPWAVVCQNGGRFRTGPMVIERKRAEVAATISAVGSEIHSYPGVLCQDHGQRAATGSASIDLMTSRFRARL